MNQSMKERAKICYLRIKFNAALPAELLILKIKDTFYIVSERKVENMHLACFINCLVSYFLIRL